MKIYTKKGDRGETGLFGSRRVSKHSKRIDAYGTVDELNSIVGFVLSMNPPQELASTLEGIQRDLFLLGSDLATPMDSSSSVPRVQSTDIARIEKHIDAIDSQLEPLKNFVLPGGTQVAAMLHVARTVCRRAERRVVKLARKEDLGAEPVMYLNRLADFLFVLARYANHLAGEREQKWERSGQS